MAATTGPRSTVKLNDAKLKVIPLAAGALVFQGSLVAVKDGFALPAAADAIVATIEMFSHTRMMFTGSSLFFCVLHVILLTGLKTTLCGWSASVKKLITLRLIERFC